MFSVFSSPQDIPYIDRIQFIKAVREDRFPTGFNEKEIEFLFDTINASPFPQPNPMNFESFCFIFNMHRLFRKYSKIKPLQLNVNELSSLIDDALFPSSIKLSIDTSITHLNSSDYLEGSLILQRMRINERDFYFSFKSLEPDNNFNIKYNNNNNTIFDNVIIKNKSIELSEVFKFKQNEEPANKGMNSYYFDVPKNPQNRYYFYLSMTGADKLSWTKYIFYRVFISCNLFTEMVRDQRFLVSISDILDSLPNMYDRVNPPISLYQRDNYLFWKNIPRDAHIDIISFCAVENFRVKFELHKLNKIELINETLLKIIMKDLGFSRMPDTVIDLAKRGYDSLRRRIYNPIDAFKYLIITHIAASENKRNQIYFQKYNLDPVVDPSRKFLQYPRRLSASYMA